MLTRAPNFSSTGVVGHHQKSGLGHARIVDHVQNVFHGTEDSVGLCWLPPTVKTVPAGPGVESVTPLFNMNFVAVTFDT